MEVGSSAIPLLQLKKRRLPKKASKQALKDQRESGIADSLFVSQVYRAAQGFLHIVFNFY